jgi:hypothetical protein
MRLQVHNFEVVRRVCALFGHGEPEIIRYPVVQLDGTRRECMALVCCFCRQYPREDGL